MRIIFVCTLVLSLVLFCQCRKSTKDKAKPCLSDAPTIRYLVNADATIKLIGTEYYLIEQGAINTRLYPCYLAPELRIHNLRVRLDGEVKATVNNHQICCVEDLIISKITP